MHVSILQLLILTIWTHTTLDIIIIIIIILFSPICYSIKSVT